MIVNRLTERMGLPRRGSENAIGHRLLFMVDEFPSLKRMEIFAGRPLVTWPATV